MNMNRVSYVLIIVRLPHHYNKAARLELNELVRVNASQC